jgi:tetratricopeptide (TPR) repeat protein
MIEEVKNKCTKKAMNFSSLSDPAGIRTQDPYIKSVLLYQLSYGIEKDSLNLTCDPAGIRTQDPYIKSVLLYQLSYGIKKEPLFKTCDPAGIRTQDPYIKSVLLYQLSYGIKRLIYNCYSQMRMQKYGFFNRIQNPSLKIFLLFFTTFLQFTDTKAQNDIAKKADSLFSSKNYREAAKQYEAIFDDPKVNIENISLKLAYIYENEENIPKALFYLNSYYNLNPSDEVFDKMNKLALLNKYSGYERNNINFVFAIYQQYYIFILYAMIALGVFILWVLYNKKIHKKPIYRNNWMLGIIYLVLLGILINVPSSYRSAIVKDKTYLRNFPSSAATIIGEINPGNKINIFGSDDIWQKAYWERSVVYVNKSDLWLLEN